VSRRTDERDRARSLVDALNALIDALRSGASLRQAFEGPAGEPWSPFRPIAEALRAGRPLVPTLHSAAQSPNAELSSVCCVLAVHADAGGDPLPACRALAERVALRQSSKDEARALTTQSRLGARTILFLTPAFLLLMVLSDPASTARWFVHPRTRTAIVAGLALQGAGMWWIAAIVRNATGSDGRAARLPGLRVFSSVLAGRARTTGDEDVADLADIVALVLDAGLSPTAAIGAAAPYARGRFGEALRTAVADRDITLAEALETVTAEGSEAELRFVRAVVASMDLGVPLAPALRSLAEDLRRSADHRVAEDIRRASIRVLIPLGALVLPAFVLACLVPLFVSGMDGLANV
jgi:Flp pilus assembly protein TadB